MADNHLAALAALQIGGQSYTVLSYVLREAIFEVGSARCEIVQYEQADVPDPAALIDQHAELTLKLNDGSQSRSYAGLVISAERVHTEDDVQHVTLVIAPRMWLLSKRADCRIFQQQSVVDIVKKVLAGGGAPDQDWATTGGTKPRDYVVQYRETDLEFVMRLCSEEGIYFWVASSDGKDTVYFSDKPDGVGPISGSTSLVYRPRFGRMDAGDYVSHVQQVQRVRSDKVSLRDYDPEHPKLKLDTSGEGTDPGPHEAEVYVYPGRYTDTGVGSTLATILVEELQVDRNLVTGDVANLSLELGKTFSVESHPYAPLNQEYVVIGLDTHSLNQRTFAVTSADQEAPEFAYRCRFRAVPTQTTKLRPPRLARAAVMPGLQTAITTGAPGEEIYTNKSGQVKVQFHWDRLGKKDDKSSRWMRTSQLPTGGSMLLPRTKWEVAVRFNESDADNPYVMARLYNGTTPPPYALPENKGRSSLQTATTPGGGSVNEFRMQDTKGSEEFFVNASKDMTVEVGNSTTEQVGNDQQRNVGENHKLNVTNSVSASVGANQTIDVTGNQAYHVETFMVDQVGGAHTLAISGNRTMMVGGDHKRTVGADSTLTVNGMMLDAVVGDVTDATLADFNHKVGGAFVEITAGGRTVTVGGNRSDKTGLVKIVASKAGRGVDVGGNLNVKVAGAIINKADGDKSESASTTYMELAAGAQMVKANEIVLEADTLLSLVMGASTITLMPAMVAIAGISLKVDGDSADEAALILDN